VVEQAPVRELFLNPKHPYTQGLLQAVPTKHTNRGELAGIPGSLPDLANPPSGCRFHPRCPHATEICRQQVPPTITVGPEHSTSCHLYPEAT
jgi:peptide/nickel transport system ATP-binding protein